MWSAISCRGTENLTLVLNPSRTPSGREDQQIAVFAGCFAILCTSLGNRRAGVGRSKNCRRLTPKQTVHNGLLEPVRATRQHRYWSK